MKELSQNKPRKLDPDFIESVQKASEGMKRNLANNLNRHFRKLSVKGQIWLLIIFVVSLAVYCIRLLLIIT